MAIASKEKDSVILRLRRIEGQIKGIQRMIEEGKQCRDILIQIAAVRSAINSVGGLILENYMKNCLKDYLDGSVNEESLNELVDIMVRYTK
ncbi:MAG TPA: metal-sensitive transcriptional regulator [Tissierellia bacterium]|nr:metal-sensitive transcriptional regulator [Tissierellia bacterium]